MTAGAVCAYADSDVTEEMNLDQFIEFLEPKTTPPERAGAVCVSSADYAALKTVIDQLCRKAGASCTKEAKENIRQVSARIERMQAKAKLKKPQTLPFIEGDSKNQ